MPKVSVVEWEQFISQYPDAHLLQTAPWGLLKAHFGWQVVHLVSGGLGAQVLFRQIFPGITLAYVPKGPTGLNCLEHPDWPSFLRELDAVCRSKHAFCVKIEPDLWELSPGLPNTPSVQENSSGSFVFLPSDAIPAGFRLSPHSIQPLRTLMIDLRGSEEALLNRMRQKTRYNIRLAQRHEVVISPSGDIELFYALMRSTSERDRFGIHSLEYYRQCYELFHPRGECELLIATYQGQPLAALMAFCHGKRAWYFYGASTSDRRELMPNYLLQWEAMRWARRQGCQLYDLWGVPDADEAELESNFNKRNNGLWGVYRFKRGFGGVLMRSIGPWDRVYLPWLYPFYLFWVRRGRRESGAG